MAVDILLGDVSQTSLPFTVWVSTFLAMCPEHLLVLARLPFDVIGKLVLYCYI